MSVRDRRAREGREGAETQHVDRSLELKGKASEKIFIAAPHGYTCKSAALRAKVTLTGLVRAEDLPHDFRGRYQSTLFQFGDEGNIHSFAL